MTNRRQKISMSDIEAVGYGKLILAAIIGLPVGAILGYVFAVIWLALLPAGDIILVVLPVIGGIGGFINAPMILVRKNMANKS